MLTATAPFLESLENWLKSVRAEDFDSSRLHATMLQKAGELLVIHPDFSRCFARHVPGMQTNDALRCLCQVLLCAAEGRARALNKPFNGQVIGNLGTQLGG